MAIHGHVMKISLHMSVRQSIVNVRVELGKVTPTAAVGSWEAVSNSASEALVVAMRCANAVWEEIESITLMSPPK